MDYTGFIQKIENADISVCENADSFLQSQMWGDFKERFGWKSRAFILEWNGFGAHSLLVLCRTLSPALAFAYIPWGPELPSGFPAAERMAALAELVLKLKKFLPPNIVFIRCDPPWLGETAGDLPVKSGSYSGAKTFRRSAVDIQPPDTVLVDLRASGNEILAAMKPKWRYNIRLAEKHGIIIREEGEQGLEVFYKLLEETARRDGIAIHNRAYYRTLFELCNTPNAGKAMKNSKTHTQLNLYIARHEKDALAAIVVLFRGTQATYLYGSSSDIKRNLMAVYALQWRAMQDAKSCGCRVYDMFGIPPSDDPAHPMAGLFRFKTGFGGKIVHRPGSWDYPCKALRYSLFSAAEALRKKIRDKKKH